jgi:hypothetical protein
VPSAAGRHLGQPHEERRPHRVVRERLADAARVAAQQPQRLLAQVAGEVDVAVGAHAGREPVDAPVLRGLRGGAAARRDPLARGRGELDVDRLLQRRGGDRRGGERLVSDAQRGHAGATQPQTLEGRW